MKTSERENKERERERERQLQVRGKRENKWLKRQTGCVC
jgi:hypothetical protein